MANDSSITLLNTLEWAKKLNFNRRASIGSYLEPAITNANLIAQTILGAPFTWRWNRVTTGFVCIAGQQDYFIFNWTPLTLTQANLWFTVDDAGNSQQVSVAGTTGTSAPAWNHTKGGLTSDGTVTWLNLGSINTPVSQTYSLAWIEKASVQDISPTLANPKWYEIESNLDLALDSSEGRPRNVSAQVDDGNGNITFRLMMIPDKAYPVAITMQQKPPVFSKNGLGVNQTWSPIPDEYSRLYEWGFLALFFLFADDPRFTFANQKFVTSLLSTSEGLTATEINIFLSEWQYVTGQPVVYSNTVAQGTQARAV